MTVECMPKKRKINHFGDLLVHKSIIMWQHFYIDKIPECFYQKTVIQTFQYLYMKIV